MQEGGGSGSPWLIGLFPSNGQAGPCRPVQELGRERPLGAPSEKIHHLQLQAHAAGLCCGKEGGGLRADPAAALCGAAEFGIVFWSPRLVVQLPGMEHYPRAWMRGKEIDERES